MKVGFYLDDIRVPDEIPPQIDEWITCKNYQEFTEKFIKYYREFRILPKIFSFDHDLSDIDSTIQITKEDGADKYLEYKEKTGLHAAKWLCETCLSNHIKLDSILCVHSQNPVGAENIQKYINHYLRSQELPETCFLHKWKVKDSNQEN